MIKLVWKGFCVIGFALFFVGLPSCEKQAPRLRSAERKIVDSLYNMKISPLKQELDSICNESKQARIDYMVDSIMKLRIAERKKRLGY